MTLTNPCEGWQQCNSKNEVKGKLRKVTNIVARQKYENVRRYVWYVTLLVSMSFITGVGGVSETNQSNHSATIWQVTCGTWRKKRVIFLIFFFLFFFFLSQFSSKEGYVIHSSGLIYFWGEISCFILASFSLFFVIVFYFLRNYFYLNSVQ